MYNEEDSFKKAAEDTDEFIQKMNYQYEPSLIAAFLVIKGMGLYKAFLPPKDYDMMCEKIYNQREEIKKHFV